MDEQRCCTMCAQHKPMTEFSNKTSNFLKTCSQCRKKKSKRPSVQNRLTGTGRKRTDEHQNVSLTVQPQAAISYGARMSYECHSLSAESTPSLSLASHLLLPDQTHTALVASGVALGAASGVASGVASGAASSAAAHGRRAQEDLAPNVLLGVFDEDEDFELGAGDGASGKCTGDDERSVDENAGGCAGKATGSEHSGSDKCSGDECTSGDECSGSDKCSGGRECASEGADKSLSTDEAVSYDS